MHMTLEHISLSQAAQIAPGRPHTNCVWRWCRRGVLSRAGERVKLQHIRIGGKIFTTSVWVEEFGKRLAEADAKHFDLNESVAAPMRVKIKTRSQQRRDADIERAERELQEAGI